MIDFNVTEIGKARGFTLDMMGFIPLFLSEYDPRDTKAQLNANYAHGGGWRKFEGFKLLENESIQYPGDPPHPCLAKAFLRGEEIRYYDYSWVMVVAADGSWEISRMD